MSIKKIAAMGLLSLTLTTCSTPVLGEQRISTVPLEGNVLTKIFIFNDKAYDLVGINKEMKRIQKLELNTIAMKKAIKKIHKHVNKTKYVFSGSTPAGWDCSGLTKWFYKQLGVSLEHRASKQGKAGKITKNPKLGDIVSFTYKNSKSAYHVGIYIGDGKMIHAPKPGEITSIDNIKKFGGKYSKIEYFRLIQTL